MPLKTITDHETILKMLETVDPSDTETLDEIDARIWCFKEKLNYVSNHYGVRGDFSWYINTGKTQLEEFHDHSESMVRYTRSLDASHAIVPEVEKGWWSYGLDYFVGSTRITVTRSCDFGSDRYGPFETPQLALAYAVVKMIAYERGFGR